MNEFEDCLPHAYVDEAACRYGNANFEADEVNARTAHVQNAFFQVSRTKIGSTRPLQLYVVMTANETKALAFIAWQLYWSSSMYARHEKRSAPDNIYI